MSSTILSNDVRKMICCGPYLIYRVNITSVIKRCDGSKVLPGHIYFRKHTSNKFSFASVNNVIICKLVASLKICSVCICTNNIRQQIISHIGNPGISRCYTIKRCIIFIYENHSIIRRKCRSIRAFRHCIFRMNIEFCIFIRIVRSIESRIRIILLNNAYIHSLKIRAQSQIICSLYNNKLRHIKCC